MSGKRHQSSIYLCFYIGEVTHIAIVIYCHALLLSRRFFISMMRSERQLCVATTPTFAS